MRARGTIMIRKVILTILHAESSLSPSQAPTRLTMVFVLLVKSVCLEELTDAVQEVYWCRL